MIENSNNNVNTFKRNKNNYINRGNMVNRMGFESSQQQARNIQAFAKNQIIEPKEPIKPQIEM